MKNSYNLTWYVVKHCIVVNNRHYQGDESRQSTQFEPDEDDVIKTGKIQLRMKEGEAENGLENIYAGYEVSMGTVCGWCVGADSLLVTPDKTRYEYIYPCNDNDYVIDTLTIITERNELMGMFDMKKFQGITINTCHFCADGCDTWVSVKNDTITHRIRFGYNDTLAITGIKPFLNKLNSIRAQYRKN